MDYFSWGLITIIGCYSLKNAETKQLRNLYTGLYGAIFIIGIAYMSGEQLGEAIYYLSHIKR